MRKNLELYLDLYDVENKEPYYKIAEIIEKNNNITIVWYDYKSYIFVNYLNLIKWNMSLEEFMVAWDINSDQRIFQTNKLESLFEIATTIHEWINKFSNSLILVPQISINYFKHYSMDKYNELVELLAKNNSYLMGI